MGNCSLGCSPFIYYSQHDCLLLSSFMEPIVKSSGTQPSPLKGLNKRQRWRHMTHDPDWPPRPTRSTHTITFSGIIYNLFLLFILKFDLGGKRIEMSAWGTSGGLDDTIGAMGDGRSSHAIANWPPLGRGGVIDNTSQITFHILLHWPWSLLQEKRSNRWGSLRGLDGWGGQRGDHATPCVNSEVLKWKLYCQSCIFHWFICNGNDIW